MLFDLDTWTTATNAVEDYASTLVFPWIMLKRKFEQSILDTILNPMGTSFCDKRWEDFARVWTLQAARCMLQKSEELSKQPITRILMIGS